MKGLKSVAKSSIIHERAAIICVLALAAFILGGFITPSEVPEAAAPLAIASWSTEAPAGAEAAYHASYELFNTSNTFVRLDSVALSPEPGLWGSQVTRVQARTGESTRDLRFEKTSGRIVVDFGRLGLKPHQSVELYLQVAIEGGPAAGAKWGQPVHRELAVRYRQLWKPRIARLMTSGY